MEALKAAIEAARIGGAIALEAWGKPQLFREKERRADIVTDTDHASESAIVASLRREFPGATYLTEEGGVHAGSTRERWIIDPIDGTTNFAHGYPLFCVSIAYEVDGALQAAAIYAPAMKELFTATRGGGAQRNGQPMRVSAIASLGDAMTCTGFHPADYERNARYFGAVSHRAQAVRRDGSAALDLAYVACGRFDGFWEWDLNPWDVAAGTLLIEEAGGSVTRIDGSTPAIDARSICASNGLVHNELLEVLASAR